MTTAATPTLARTLDKFSIDDGCWAWLAGTNGKGYGVIGVGRRGQGKAYAHRVIYEALVAQIHEGQEIDHLCHRRDCVRPSHLEAVTRQENIKRQRSHGPSRGGTCARGHAMVGYNVEVACGNRRCRACAIAARARRARA